MNETRVSFLLEALELATQPEDYNFRQAVRSELASELALTPPSLAVGASEECCEEGSQSADVGSGEKAKLKEAFRLFSEVL